MTQSPMENPFDLNKASDFTDREIADQWVDLASSTGGLVDILNPKSRMPMLLLGGKGSGKTHLMRYCSAPVQAARHNRDVAQAAVAEGYLGIYVPLDALNTDKFAREEPVEDYWIAVFSYYFELWLSSVLLSTIRDCARSQSIEFDETEFVKSAIDLFDITPENPLTNLDSLYDHLAQMRKHIDSVVNNSRLRGERPIFDITFSAGRLIFGLPELATQHAPAMKDVLFVYLIDEVENLTADQQRFLNSLIRYRRGSATIRVGGRLYGMKTLETTGSGEPIRSGAEYERVVLDEILRRESGQYDRFVRSLISKRLERAGYSTAAREPIDSYFEELDSRDYWRSIDKHLPTTKQGQITPYHQKLATDLKSAFGLKDHEVTSIYEALQVPEHRFLEKAATFQFRKSWPSSLEDAVSLASTVGSQARALAQGDRVAGAELAKLISYFSSDILAQLFHDYARRLPYSGFETMVELSQGITRNLLVNLKHIFRRSRFAGEEPFISGSISIKSQSDGVRDGAAWFWEDAQPPSGGLQVRDAVENVAVLFRTVRLGHSPSECALCAFSVPWEALSDNSRRTLMVAENWSYLVKLQEGRRNKNSKRIDALYQLGPMLAPRWEVSQHRRGTIELQQDLADAILDPQHRHELATLMKKRLERIILPAGSKTVSNPRLI
ncbi:hypothetical protein [Parvularcula dongshanensis]|uniref:Uncharacterized protein n=1 Tax=Parvularcula dongshanensis TaxID=1173995 RepID=A0A840I4R2_9PROT|nr:hypothetical protein [Parvularcula dongshanensis]MBB4659325.1 hypothetical protein [Parvularcula dongshanensis]